MILEIGHEMLWGKDFQSLVKANIAMVKDLLNKYKNYGSSIRVISLVTSGQAMNFVARGRLSHLTCGAREIRMVTSMS